MMSRRNFKEAVKLFSYYRIDKRKGNYRLPDGKKLSKYLYELVLKMLSNNQLAIKTDGNISDIEDGTIKVLYGDNERLNQEEQNKRAKILVCEMLDISWHLKHG